MHLTIEPPIEWLEPPERFVICAVRICRSLREQPEPRGPCICRVFQEAQMLDALRPFSFFEAALNEDSARNFRAQERLSRTIGTGELRILAAISFWQRHPALAPETPVALIEPAPIRQAAAYAGRSFAREMAVAGLVLRPPETYCIENAANTWKLAEPLAGGLRHVH